MEQEEIRGEEFMSIKKLELKSQEITDLIISTTITEGSPFVKYTLKNETELVAVDVDRELLYTRDSKDRVTETKITEKNKEWLDLAKKDIKRGNYEIYRQ